MILMFKMAMAEIRSQAPTSEPYTPALTLEWPRRPCFCPDPDHATPEQNPPFRSEISMHGQGKEA